MIRPRPGAKYRNVKTQLDGLTFDSKAEAAYYAELKLREKAGEVRHIRRQVRYPLDVNGIKICDYIADFVYEELQGFRRESGFRNGEAVWRQAIVDVKSPFSARLPVYRLKAKLMAALGTPILECISSQPLTAIGRGHSKTTRR